MEASKCHERPGRNRKATGMSVTRMKYRVGELRPSQVLFTYAIGSIVDLPYISTMVMGLDDWQNPYPAMVGEERLLQAVRFFFQAEDGIRDLTVTGVQTCALPI